MTDTYVKILNKIAVLDMSCFGPYNRIFLSISISLLHMRQPWALAEIIVGGGGASPKKAPTIK